MLKPFNFGELTELDDGRIRVAFDHALGRIHHDLSDRATVKKARKITLTVSLTPVADERGQLDDVDMEISFKETVPARESKSYRMSSRGGELLVNELSPDNPDQGTLDAPGGITPLRRAAR